MEKNIAQKINPYLSNLVVLYTKLHDQHWNVKGKMFVQVHLYTESRYDDLAEKFDAVAEKVLMLGEKPVSTMKEYLEFATIKELEKKDYTCTEVLEEVLKDTETLKKQAQELHDAFDKEGLFTIVMMMEDHIASYEKEIWFLKSMLA